MTNPNMARAYLTEKQDQFCCLYVKSGNVSEAYRKSYNGQSSRLNTAAVAGYKLLRNTKIADRIEALKAEVKGRHDIDVDWLVQEFLRVYNKALADDPILDRKGEQTGVNRFDGCVANKSLELIARLTGLLVDKKEVSTPPGQPFEVLLKSGMASWTNEQLEDLAGLRDSFRAGTLG